MLNLENIQNPLDTAQALLRSSQAAQNVQASNFNYALGAQNFLSTHGPASEKAVTRKDTTQINDLNNFYAKPANDSLGVKGIYNWLKIAEQSYSPNNVEADPAKLTGIDKTIAQLKVDLVRDAKLHINITMAATMLSNGLGAVNTVMRG